ncbi:hypothetical protein [Micromonospora sp. NPDC050200]|uniref:hypothetical protein n=1 Tax=Micromonospora sp. NPDC050200 TaxID=3155664 RepID=UPI0033DE2C7E
MQFRPAFIAAPVLVMGYGIIRLIDGLDGTRGPGPAWTIGHLAFLGALIAFISAFWQMRRMVGGRVLATVSATAGTLGALALIAQFSIDLGAGFLATDNYGMSMIINQVRATGPVRPDWPTRPTPASTCSPPASGRPCTCWVEACPTRRSPRPW